MKYDKKARQHLILAAALAVAETVGLYKLTRAEVARVAGVSPGLVSFYFLDIETLKTRVIEEAIARESLGVVAFALMSKHPAAAGCPAALAARARGV